MKRAPIVLGGTAAGLAAVLSIHTGSSPSTALASSSLSTQSASASSTPATSSTRSTSSTSTSTSHTGTTGTTAPATSSTTTTSSSTATTRSATGSDISFQYGDIQLKVTATGTKVTHVSVVKIGETDPRSQQIDAYAVPQLTQEVLAAGSANIQAVSGASYTSQAYYDSLQSALDKLGIKA